MQGESLGRTTCVNTRVPWCLRRVSLQSVHSKWLIWTPSMLAVCCSYAITCRYMQSTLWPQIRKFQPHKGRSNKALPRVMHEVPLYGLRGKRPPLRRPGYSRALHAYHDPSQSRSMYSNVEVNLNWQAVFPTRFSFLATFPRLIAPIGNAINAYSYKTIREISCFVFSWAGLN